jgi:hypothetical protein
VRQRNAEMRFVAGPTANRYTPMRQVSRRRARAAQHCGTAKSPP